MKKILAYVLLAVMLCSCASCDETMTTDSDLLASTTEDSQTSDTTQTEWSETTTQTKETESTETKHSETTDHEQPSVVEDPFESFIPFHNPNSTTDDTLDCFWGKMIYNPEGRYLGDPQLLIFRVVEGEIRSEGKISQYAETIEGVKFTQYSIQLVDIYGFDSTKLDTEKIHMIAYKGRKSKQMYGRPPLEAGKLYARIMTFGDIEQVNDARLYQAGLFMPVEEVDGVYYLYGYGIDFCNMECKIEITDPEENSIYKIGKHDKTIAYLESIGQELPTFDYKCESKAFYEEICRRNREGLSW